jgi:prepilin-type processing-associated H-X9-DG protein
MLSASYRVPLMLDCLCTFPQPGWTDAPPALEGLLKTSDLPNDMKTVCLNRHEGGINSLFLDASVRKVGLKELWTLNWYPGYATWGAWTKAGGVRPEDWPLWMQTLKDY